MSISPSLSLSDLLEEFDVYALCYGDYFDLAKQCLESIALLRPTVGLNQVCQGTRDLVDQLGLPGIDSQENIHKYPMMRRLFSRGPRRKYTMWFDDDSYLKEAVAANPRNWLFDIREQFRVSDMLGMMYQIRFNGQQREWLQQQPWHRGKDKARSFISFCTGGWWVIRTEILEQFNYPWSDLDHNGGDTMLGELLSQQGLLMTNFSRGVMINAGNTHQHSGAPRRGYSGPPLGTILTPPKPQPTKIPFSLDL